MNRGTDVPAFPSDIKKSEKDTMSATKGNAEEKLNYSLSDEYIERFDLNMFLKRIWDESLPANKTFKGTTFRISTDDDLIKFLVMHMKAKKYIGVGVGGIFIKSIQGKDYLLVYKRYHEPENQVWSMLGGSSIVSETIEDTLKRKIVSITKVRDLEPEIVITSIIRANNHLVKNDYHYLSPAYYYVIKDIEHYFYFQRIDQKPTASEQRKCIYITDSYKDLDKIGESEEKDPKLAWFPVNEIKKKSHAGIRYFSTNTVNAVDRHKEIYKESHDIYDAAERISTTIDWRRKYQDVEA